MATAGADRDPTLTGRDKEIALTREFLGASSDGFATLAIEGEAGIGKTTVFEAVLSECDVPTHRVLTTWRRDEGCGGCHRLPAQR